MTATSAGVSAWLHLYRPGREDAPVLLMLHGTGSNERDIASLAGALAPDAGILAPRGRVQEHGTLRWFRRRGEGVFDVDDVIARSRELAAFIGAARDHYGLGDRKLVAEGFSNPDLACQPRLRVIARKWHS
jgi:phospholipase/carboxylesterase